MPYGQLFTSSCGGLQPLAANGWALWAQFFQDFPANLVWKLFLGDFFGGNFFQECFPEIFKL